RAHKYEQAIPVFSALLESVPKEELPYYHYYRGYSRYKIGRMEAAAQDMRKVQELSSSDEWYTWMIGNSYLVLSQIAEQEGDFPKSREYLLSAIQSNSGQSTLYTNLALLELKMENPEAALIAAKEAVQLKDDNAAAWNNYGLVLLKLGKLRKARKVVDKSLWLNPTNPYAYRNRALIFIAEGDQESACADLAKCLETNVASTTRQTLLLDAQEINALIAEHCR
ncbi:MAG: tetratricopeptide repeat protein, partial [Bacteroidota bacterium]